MSACDRDTNEASPKKNIKWYTQSFYGRVLIWKIRISKVLYRRTLGIKI